MIVKIWRKFASLQYYLIMYTTHQHKFANLAILLLLFLDRLLLAAYIRKRDS